MYPTIEIDNINKTQRKYKFIPETKTRLNQTDEINKVCPMSGWRTNNKRTGITINVLNKNLKLLLEVNLDPITNERNTTKNGFKNSTGWNLGNIAKFNHLFEPFTSTPKNGISNKDIKKITNNIIAIL